MAQLRNRPLFTDECQPIELAVDPGTVYLFGRTFEQRSAHVESLAARSTGVRFVEVIQTSIFGASAKEGADQNTLEWSILLRNRGSVSDFLAQYAGAPLMIDVTGLPHNVWAPLVRVALEEHSDVKALYVEPQAYAYSSSPRQGEIFDLSESISGIGPIPLFANLADSSQSSCFIPLLGFEGARFAYLVEQVQPADEKIYPIIGIPGFRAEYPFHAYLANATTLDRTRSFRNVRYAKSNCPFSLVYAVQDIVAGLPNDHIKIGLAGTKPHALGAVLLAVAANRSIELIYDQVKRKPNRTTGAQRCLTYHLTDFMPEAIQQYQRAKGR